MMRVYQYHSATYGRKITFTGVICAAILAYAAIKLLMGGTPAVWVGVGAIAAYTVWETFISLSNPSKIAISDEGITFYAYGREHSYLWKDIEMFRIKEFPGARKLFIRINGAGFLKGRYWLHCYYFNDSDELYGRMVDKEYQIHPNTVKAWARDGSKPAKQ